MESAMINAMCRCCASEGAFKDVKSRYLWMGEEEIYSDMLKECFDINLFTSEDGDDGGICEVCITQLRNAVNFKKQVLHTEDQFKKHLQNKLFKPSIVKVEIAADDDNDSDDNVSAEEGYSGTEYEIPIKTEIPEEPKPKKRAAAAKATSSRAKKAKSEDGETSTKREEQSVSGKDNVKSEAVDNTKSEAVNNIKSEAVDNIESEAVSVVVEDSEKDTAAKTEVKTKTRTKDELEKHYQNLKELLENTNATPILRRGRIGYMCSYCPEEFLRPAQLKTHTLETHKNQGDPVTTCSKSVRMNEYLIKLDITGLRCSLCNVNINSLDGMIQHLTDEHNKIIHGDINNHIIPFKFDTDELVCCHCSSVFHKFKILQEHMHRHYGNYICDVCGSGYVNQGCLIRHKETHKKGTFECYICTKIFDTNVKVKSHIRSTHTHSNCLNRCGYCNEGFRDHRQKEEHLVKVHGVVSSMNKCAACDKSFTTTKKLKAHVKRDHLMERRHECPHCDMKFFRGYELSDHLVKHTGVKKYQCAMCFKAYGRKTTLREHMRIHLNDRRFKCDHCNQTFVQKCSWKSHMKTKHDVDVI